MMTGATKATTLSTKPASKKAPSRPLPPSTSNAVTSRVPRRRRSSVRSTRPSAPGVAYDLDALRFEGGLLCIVDVRHGQQRSTVLREHGGGLGQTATAVDDHADGLGSRDGDIPHGEQRVVGEGCADADHDGAGLGAEPMRGAARRLA